MSSFEDSKFSDATSFKTIISQLQLEKDKFIERQSAIKADLELENRRISHPNQRMPRLSARKCPNAYWNSSLNYKPFPAVPAISQENAVVADLILVCTGVSGRYIYPDKNLGSFIINDGLESSCVQMAKTILPLATSFIKVSKFVEEKRVCVAGKVNHALAAGLGKLCWDYLAVISRLSLEHKSKGLNLQNFCSRIRPYIYIFQTLADVCAKVGQEGRGGRTLSILHNAVRNSSGKTELLLQHLLETAAVPYMDQLHTWLTKGVVHDVYAEFLVEDNQLVIGKELLPDDYAEDFWHKCYTLCKERTPDFLEHLSQAILRTGKYLNVLHQCGVVRSGSSIPKMQYSCTEDKFSESIRLAHESASNGLHKLMVDVDLAGHLRSVRNYLLLAQGDFVTKFMDMAAPELEKSIGDIVPSRLQSLLELALRTSTANCDPYKDLLRVEVDQQSILEVLNDLNAYKGSSDNSGNNLQGWEAVKFVYTASWPVSLVLCPSTLTMYQLIFRHLIYCRYVERLLCRVWLEHKRSELWAAWDLRQRMLLYVSNLEYYMLVEVIEPEWNELMKKLANLNDLDEVLQRHAGFLSNCHVKCMLANAQHFRVLNTFLRKCVEFCKFMDACGLVEASPIHTPKARAVAFTPAESFSAKINEFNKSFTQHVQYLFRTLSETDTVHRSDKLTDMLYRLDFNCYYKTSVEEKVSRDSVSTISGE